MLTVYQIQTFKTEIKEKTCTPFPSTRITDSSTYKYSIIPIPSSYAIKCKFNHKISPYLFSEYRFNSFKK